MAPPLLLSILATVDTVGLLKRGAGRRNPGRWATQEEARPAPPTDILAPPETRMLRVGQMAQGIPFIWCYGGIRQGTTKLEV